MKLESIGHRMIPISKPFLDIKEAHAASEAVMSGWVTQGPRVEKFENLFSNYVGSEYACAVSSCTTGLHIALLAVGVKPGDFVITTSHSYIATANAIRYCSAEPIFIDIDKSSFNIDPHKIEAFLDKHCIQKNGKVFCKNPSFYNEESPLNYIKDELKGKISAILPVHQMGMPCEIDKIINIGRRFNIPIVEDAACAIGSEIKLTDEFEKIGKPHGDIACFSLHPRKIITTGDGGMLTTNNKDYLATFKLLRQHGMNIPDTIRHNSKNLIIEEYPVLGYNYRMTDIQGAIGTEQLNKLPKILTERRNIYNLYKKQLENINWIKIPDSSKNIKSNWQSFPITILDNSPLDRNQLIQHLLDNNISSKPGIMNSHSEAPHKSKSHELPISEYCRENVILIPFFNGLKEKDIYYISSVFRKI